MDVRNAQAFVAVAEELHFGKAAQRLHMAQPPLSRLIRQLEADLGAPLFERNTRKVELTAQGEALLEPARELIMLSQRMREIAKQAELGETGRVSLGFGEAAANQIVGELARHVRQSYPGISLDLVNSQFWHTGIEKLIDGRLDLLIGRWDLLPAEVDSFVIGYDDELICMPDNHPLASRESVAPEDLAAEPWVVLQGGNSPLPNRINRLAQAGGFVPRIVQVAPDSSTLLLLVAAGIGISLSLSTVRDNLPTRGVVFKPLNPGNEPLPVRMIWRRADRNPVVDKVLGIAKELLEDQGH